MSRRTLERMLWPVIDVASILAAWSGVSAFIPRAGYTGSTLPVLPVLGLWLVAAEWSGVYHMPDVPDRWERMRAAARSAITVAFALMTVSYFAGVGGTAGAQRFAVGLVASCFALFAITHVGLAALMHRLGNAVLPQGHVAVLGYDTSAISVLEHLRSSAPDSVRGLIIPEGRQTTVAARAKVLGSTSQLAEVINREKLDRIVILNGSLTQGEMEACSAISTRMGVTMSCAVAVAASAAGSLNYSLRYGIPVVEIAPRKFTATDRALKRALDIVASGFSLVLFSPFLLLIAFLVKATSEGPIFYKAARVGRGGRYFTFLKFRSMYSNSNREQVKKQNEKDGHIFKMKNDPRVTPLGRFLRRYSLDELPQLINVFLGDMSMVGPRPLPIEDLEPDGMSRRFAVWSEQRATVPPGITGLWQIRGRSSLPFSDLIRYDLEYVHNWSLALDLQILLNTPKFVLTGKGAY